MSLFQEKATFEASEEKLHQLLHYVPIIFLDRDPGSSVGLGHVSFSACSTVENPTA
jgi:hypothetical protein